MKAEGRYHIVIVYGSPDLHEAIVEYEKEGYKICALASHHIHLFGTKYTIIFEKE